MSGIPAKHRKELFALFSSVKNDREAELLLTDLLTPKELETLAERWQLVKMLAKGAPQRDVSKKLGISISKVTRGSKSLQYGQGGFEYFLQKLRKRK